jgi:C4-dicarboxylate-specific signal transduction histidine kinase
MPCGGVLSIRTEVECDRTDPKAPPKVVIEVSDDGLGMDQCVFNRCFDPLFTTKHQGGECAGLGLYSVWQTVHDAGGDVRVETTVGSGTKFRIVLPAAQNVVATSPRTNVRDEAGRHETGNQALKLAVL